MATHRTHYDNLKVARNAPDSVIKAAYKALCQTYHPDKYQGNNKEAERIMKIINASYVALIDPVQRALHDVWIKNKEAKDTEQQKYQGQEKRETPKTEESPPSAKANSTLTEAELERRRKECKEWQNKNQYTRQEQTPTNSKKSKQLIYGGVVTLFITIFTANIILLVIGLGLLVSGIVIMVNNSGKNKNTYASPKKHQFNLIVLITKAVIWMIILLLFVTGKQELSIVLLILWGLVLWAAVLRRDDIEKRWRLNQRQYKTDTPKTEDPIFSIISKLLKIVGGTVLVILIWIYAASIVFKPLTVNSPPPKPSEHQVVTETIQKPVPIFNQPEQPIPQSGANNANFRNGVAPLKIRTSSAGGHHYFVKIVNLSNGQPIGAYFIRSGETIDIKIPLGTYEIRYASGTTWYGLDYLFGPDTTYSKADSTFNFSFDGYQYSGYTIELIMQQNGNLSTSQIKPNQW